MAGNTVYVQGSYVDVHDNEVVNLSIGKATVNGVDLDDNDNANANLNDNANSSAAADAQRKEELNLFAPKKHLQELLKGAWFAEVRTAEKYDAAWTDGFMEALMASEFGEGIARQWAVKGAREKKNQLKGYVVGLLKDAGVLRGSYDAIAARVGITSEARTFSRYMGKGKRQPYAEWVREYVAGQV